MVMLCGWLACLLLSGYGHLKNKTFTAYSLGAAAICIAAAFALFSPYLYAWDEQFHALAARHMADHPFIPKLYLHQPLIDDPNWLDTEIWLHKQPLFTWQMALSIKLLGNTAFAARFPSVLFHGILVATVFRTGKLIFNPRTGFIAALIVMHSGFLLGLLSGRIGTDHNDYIFLCYVTLSFRSWMEWRHDKKGKWLYFTGIFVGCAILTKWLVGLLVFAGWGIVILTELRQTGWRKSIFPPLISLGTALLIAMPWQIYTFLRFPEAARREMAYNSRHLFHAVEDHSGNAWYHFDQLRFLYFNPFDLILFFTVGTIFVLIRKVRRDYRIFLFVSIGVVYLFFTIVRTKMPAFTAPVYTLVALVIAFGITELSALIASRKISKTLLIVLTLLIVNWILKPSATLAEYGLHGNKEAIAGRKYMTESLEIMRAQGQSKVKRVVFGVDLYPFSHIAWMYFNDELAYPFIPSEAQKELMRREGYEMHIFQAEKRKTKEDQGGQ